MVYAKKSLGQNFLHSKAALAEIIKAAQLKEGEQVLEIGPGRGALTEYLLASGVTVTAVEKDDELFEFLRAKFATEISDKKLNLIHGDILESATWTPSVQVKYQGVPLIFREIDLSTRSVDKYKIVANIPYYITGLIFRKFLEEAKQQPTAMVLLVQKEVADRIVAADGKESILSISVKIFGTPKFIKKIPASAFTPQPKVDSAILAIENIGRDQLKNVNEKIFFELVKKGFSQKRKVIKNNLKDHLELLSVCRIKETARAEDLKIEDWVCLAKNNLPR